MFNSVFLTGDYLFSSIPLTGKDIALSVATAVFITFLARCMVFITRLFKSVSKLDVVMTTDKDKIKQDFEKMFPLTSFSFHGVTYVQGMRLRLVTTNKKIVEGEFVGYNNNDGVICIMTERVVMAQKLSEMQEINVID